MHGWQWERNSVMPRARLRLGDGLPRHLVLVVAGLLAASLHFASLHAAPPQLRIDPKDLNLPEELPPPTMLLAPTDSPPGISTEPTGLLRGPFLSAGKTPVPITEADPEPGDRLLPINLATALRLSDARPIVIAAAQASVQVAAAQLSQAQALWLPNLYLGASDYYHTGGGTGNSGIQFNNNRNQFMGGAGFTAIFATTDAIFAPLSVRQVLRSREIDVQTAKNDALRDVAEAYFTVQQARGRLAGNQEAVVKGRELLKRVERLSKDLTSGFEIDRVRARLAEIEQQVALSRQEWRVASANLTRALRLDPATVVAPLEPPHLQVTLLSPQEIVDTLIPIGLMNRPELASQQALVEATLVRIRQERMRPLIPSLVLLGDAVPAAPGGFLMGGAFESNVNGGQATWSARFDPSMQVLWELRNMGAGNRALVRERQAQQQQAVVELYRIQDTVAAEIAQAHAQVEAALVRVAKAQVGLAEAYKNFAGNMKGLAETIRFGDILQLVVRPQEAVAALTTLNQSYENYYLTIADYNRAQFRLYWSMGYPAGVLACERTPGQVIPVNPERPPPLPPVHAPPPCAAPHCHY